MVGCVRELIASFEFPIVSFYFYQYLLAVALDKFDICDAMFYVNAFHLQFAAAAAIEFRNQMDAGIITASSRSLACRKQQSCRAKWLWRTTKDAITCDI